MRGLRGSSVGGGGVALFRVHQNFSSKDLWLVWETSIGHKEEKLGVVLTLLYSKHARGAGERTEA